MNTEQIIETKYRLEAEIANAISDFEKLTGATVTQLNISRTDFMIESTIKPFVSTINVEAKLEIIAIKA